MLRVEQGGTGREDRVASKLQTYRATITRIAGFVELWSRWRIDQIASASAVVLEFHGAGRVNDRRRIFGLRKAMPQVQCPKRISPKACR